MFNKFYFTLGTVLLCFAVLVSCKDYSPNEEAILEKAASYNYEKAFHSAFPEIDPQQNWGFDPMPICGDDIDITRGSNTNSNEWESRFHYEVPGGLSKSQQLPWGWAAGDVSNYERAYVYWWFSTHPWVQPLSINWTDFFLENVWGQPEHSKYTGDPGDHLAENSQDYQGWYGGEEQLTILTKGQTASNTPITNPITNEPSAMTHKKNSNAGYEHINDYNTGGGSQEQVMYIYDISTQDFLQFVSRSTNDQFHNNWTIQYINGNYYLAFDYWAQQDENNEYGIIPPDGYYNDWILKISSGVHTVDAYTRRVMCEDLGNTYDWDFNDLVFDVSVFPKTEGGYYAQITLQAAGGTLPIYIGEPTDKFEAHHLFGVATNIPVNVDAPTGVRRPAVVFHWDLPSDFVVTSSTDSHGNIAYKIDFEKIPIYVTRADHNQNAEQSEILPTKPAVTDLITLSSITGEAPQKFACPSDTYWMKEEKRIWTGHTNFVDWVAGRKTDSETFVTLSSLKASQSTLSDVFYADNGKPYASSYLNNGQETSDLEIKEWKYLWNHRGDDAELNSRYTEIRDYHSFMTKSGNFYVPNTNNSNYTTFSTSFEAQAPFIFETIGANDDPTAYGPRIMNEVLYGDYGALSEYKPNQEVVWSPDGKLVTLSSNNTSSGYVTGTGYYKGGSSITIVAHPRSNHSFERWEDQNGNTINGAGASYTFTVNSDITYKAIFE